MRCPRFKSIQPLAPIKHRGLPPALTGVVEGTISAATYAATEKIAYGRNPSVKNTLAVGITSGVMAGGMQYIGQKLGWIQCFIAGTLVATKAGPVPIEDIKPGDLVWATDEETGETELKEVVQIFRNETEEWVHVKVNGEEITCTPHHPFYSPQKGWTSAIDLRAGDRLQLLNGEYVVVEQVQHELLESPETTYNFEVEDYHTYYVGDSQLLVHNKCGGETTATARGKSMHKNWDYGASVQKEVSIPRVGRADGVDFTNRIVYELKPNNTRAIRQGWKQLTKYANALEKIDGGNWIRILVTYD